MFLGIQLHFVLTLQGKWQKLVFKQRLMTPLFPVYEIKFVKNWNSIMQSSNEKIFHIRQLYYALALKLVQ